jgi:GABA permease
MRLPVRSERDAYRITWATVVLVVVCVVLGALVSPILGAVLFVLAIAAAVVWDLRSPNPDRIDSLMEAEQMGRERNSAAARPRVLVVANQTLGGRELQAGLLGRDPRPELRIVAPVLISRTKYAMSDIDAELVHAARRLDQCLAWARSSGFDADGEVCPDGPLVAIEDQLRKFAADEIVISTHPAERSNWLEAGVVERARADLDIPVTHVVVDLERSRIVS